MRLPLTMVLATAACAAPVEPRPDREAHVPVEAPRARSTDDALDRLERLRLRRTWPSETDRTRWQQTLDVADRARAGLAYEPPLVSPEFAPAVDALDQMDALLRVGETARTRR